MKRSIAITYSWMIASSILLVSCRLGTTCCEPTPVPIPVANNTTTITSTGPGVFRLKIKPDSTTGKDTYVTMGVYGDNNNYTLTGYFSAEAWTYSGGDQVFRALIDFDLSAVPAGASISKATMTLYADTTTAYFGSASLPTGHSNLTGSNDWIVRRINSAWNDNTVTWNTQPATDNSHVINMPASTSRDQKYDVDVTAFIKDQVANPSLYHGFMMSLSNESKYRCIIFYSSRCIYPAFYPELNITYTK